MARVVRAGALIAALTFLASPCIAAAVIDPPANNVAKVNDATQATIHRLSFNGKEGRPEVVGQSSTLYLTYQGLAPDVAEPATWAVMMLGFGVAGSAVRRRRRMIMPRVFA